MSGGFHERFHETMRRFAAPDERICLFCLNEYSLNTDFTQLLLDDDCLCPQCRKNIHVLNRTYRVDGHNVHVLYEYNEFMEQLLFQYKEDQDIALAGLFLHGHPRLIRRLRKRQLAALASWPDKILERGFDPLTEILRPWNLDLIHPWEKTAAFKQSENDPDSRRQVAHLIRPASLQPGRQDGRRLLILDDVITTGATLQALFDLARDERCEALVLAAHPLWLAAHEKDRRAHPAFFR